MDILRTKQRKPYLVKEVGEWKFTFYYMEGNLEKTFLSITSDSGMFNCRIGGRNEAYYFLLHVAMKDDMPVLHDYVSRLYHLASVWDDAELAKDVNTAINNWHERIKAKGVEKAKSVTDAEETASQAFMEDVAAYAEASPKERKRMSEESRKEMREILKEDADKSAEQEQNQ